MLKYLLLMLMIPAISEAASFGHIKDLHKKLTKDTFGDEKWICNKQIMRPRNYAFKPLPKMEYSCYNFSGEISVSFYAKDMEVHKIDFKYNNSQDEKWQNTSPKNWPAIVGAESLDAYAQRLFNKFSVNFVNPDERQKLFSDFFNTKDKQYTYTKSGVKYWLYVAKPINEFNKTTSHILTMEKL